ncbi:MAG: SMP-30/gluconolactonase/LRE family protein [Paludibaculum sp.]
MLGTPNGRFLYVADDDASAVLRFNISGPGRLSDRMKFCDEGSDGMCFDDQGNLYLTWKMGVQVYSPDGAKLGTIPTPVDPTDVCFGGPTRSTLFITGGGKLLSVAMAVRGVE